MLHIVHKEEVIRSAVAWLAQSNNIETATYENGLSFLRKIDQILTGGCEGDCVLIDVQIHFKGYETLFDYIMTHELLYRLPVIFLTESERVAICANKSEKTSSDFFQNFFEGSLLVRRIQDAILSSNRYCAFEEIKNQLRLLSMREREVLCLLLAGINNEKIAEKLKVSRRTVEVHRSHLFKKMKVRSALELALLLGQYRHQSPQ